MTEAPPATTPQIPSPAPPDPPMQPPPPDPPMQPPPMQVPPGYPPAGYPLPQHPPGAVPVPAGVWALGPPPPPTVFTRHWSGPKGAAAPAVLIIATLAGVFAAIVLPLGRPGLAWTLTGFAITSAIFAGTSLATRAAKDRASAAGPATAPVAAEGGRAPLTTGERLMRVYWGLAALTLITMATLRAAGWLFALCLIGAFACGSLALAGGRLARGLALGATALPVAAGRSLPWVGAGLRRIRSRRPDGSTAARILVTVLVTIVLLVVFGSLFATADPAFSRLMGDILPNVDVPSVFRWIFLFVVVGMLCAGGVYLALSSPRLDGVRAATPRPLRRIEWALPVVLLDLMFAAFVAVQFEAYFGSKAYVQRMARVDYKEYTRNGFGQLVAVTVLTLLIIGIGGRRASRDTRRDRLSVRLGFGPLALLTLVVVASALSRMYHYEDEYGYTRLRHLVGVCELWLGLVFVMVLVAGVTLKATWVSRAIAGTAVATLIAIAAVNPDLWIASKNVDRYEKTGHINLDYLSTLSPDAVPALNRLTGDVRACALAPIARGLAQEKDDWRTYNLGRAQARQALREGPEVTDARCAARHTPFTGD